MHRDGVVYKSGAGCRRGRERHGGKKNAHYPALCRSVRRATRGAAGSGAREAWDCRVAALLAMTWGAGRVLPRRCAARNDGEGGGVLLRRLQTGDCLR